MSNPKIILPPHTGRVGHNEGGRRSEGHRHQQHHGASIFDNRLPNFTSRYGNYEGGNRFGHHRSEHHRFGHDRYEGREERQGSTFGDILGAILPAAAGFGLAIFGPQIGKAIGGAAKGLFGIIGGLFKGGAKAGAGAGKDVVDSTITTPKDPITNARTENMA